MTTPPPPALRLGGARRDWSGGLPPARPPGLGRKPTSFPAPLLYKWLLGAERSATNEDALMAIRVVGSEPATMQPAVQTGRTYQNQMIFFRN